MLEDLAVEVSQPKGSINQSLYIYDTPSQLVEISWEKTDDVIYIMYISKKKSSYRSVRDM